MSWRAASVEGDRHWRTDARALAEAPNAAWVRGKAEESFRRQVGTRSSSALVRALARRSSSFAWTARTMRMPRLWKDQQLSNCHRHALREWLLALKRATLLAHPIGGSLA